MTEEKAITLNCFMFGDRPTKIYLVEIAKTKTAITLRKEIPQQLSLEQADANALRLYYLKTSIRKADVEKELEIFEDPAEISCVKELPRSQTRISTLFPSPSEEDVHVIMARPSTGEYKLSFNNFDPL